MTQASADAAAGRARMSGDERREAAIMCGCMDFANDLIDDLIGRRRWLRDRIYLRPRLSAVTIDFPWRGIERHVFAADPVDDSAAWMAEIEAFLRRVFRRSGSQAKRKGERCKQRL